MGLFSFFKFGESATHISKSEHNTQLGCQATADNKVLYQLSLYGVTKDSRLSLEYFFYTNQQKKAESLNSDLEELGYQKRSIELVDETWIVSGWTQKQPMSPDSVSKWTIKMCKLGFERDCGFDGWGTIPDQSEVKVEEGLSVGEYYDLGLNLYFENKLNESQAHFSKVIEMHPDSIADVFFNRGNVRSKLGNKKGAIEDFDQAISINPNYVEAYQNRGAEKDEIEDYEGAIEDYNRSIEVNPESVLAYFNRGNTNYRLNNKEQACADWTKARDLGDDSAQERLDEYCN
ncbi:MAG: tetratricopeptide repeat protein [Saprospiraceae bacterium]